MRGGGGNFGVVTSFEFQAHPVKTVIGGMIIHPREAARDVIRFYREFTKQAPLELTAYCALLSTPDGAPVTAIIACYCGDVAESDTVLKPLREFGSPIADTLAEIERSLDAHRGDRRVLSLCLFQLMRSSACFDETLRRALDRLWFGL